MHTAARVARSERTQSFIIVSIIIDITTEYLRAEDAAPANFVILMPG